MRDVLRFIWPRRSAAAWFARLRAGPITPRLDTKYRRWLAADPANEVKYEQHELAWEVAGELSNDDEIAALLADAQRAAVETTAPRPARRHLLILAGAVASLAIIAIGANYYVRSLGDEYTYATAVGEQRSVVLPDQSRIVLNTSTQVHVVYKNGSRVVEIEKGEATFSVAHDASRPFDVVAAHGTTRAIGTEFNVLAASTGVTVSVLSGTVAITPPSRLERAAHSGDAVRLTRGEELTYSNELVSEVRPLNADRIQAWHVGRVAFEDLPLSQALAEFNRYTQTPIVIRDASLAQLRVTGIFRIGETDALLHALETAFGIRANPGAGGIELEGGQGGGGR
jgi:transmembrane sensor